MSRIPRNLPYLLVILLMVTLIGVQSNWWLAFALFFILIIAPVGYVTFVYVYPDYLLQQGKLGSAVQHYTRMLQWNLPVNSIFLLVRRGSLWNALGNIDAAIQDYSAAIQLSKNPDPTLYGVRSALYLARRDYENALADTDRLLEHVPDAELGYANRAAAKMFLGDTAGAIEDCTAGLAVSQSPSGKALLHNNRGTAYRLQGDYAEAMREYNLALGTRLSERERKVIHPSIITNQGILYYLEEDWDTSRALFNQAWTMGERSIKALAGLAAVLYKLDRLPEAQKTWMDLIHREPKYRDETRLQRELNLPMQMMGDVSELIDTMKT